MGGQTVLFVLFLFSGVLVGFGLATFVTFDLALFMRAVCVYPFLLVWILYSLTSLVWA